MEIEITAIKRDKVILSRLDLRLVEEGRNLQVFALGTSHSSEDQAADNGRKKDVSLLPR